MNEQQPSLPAISKATSLSGIGELFAKTWKIYKAKIKVLLGIILIPWAISIIASFIFSLTIASFFAVLLVTGNLIPLLFLIPIIAIAVIIGLIIGLWSELALIYTIKERAQAFGIIEAFKKVRGKIIASAWISGLVSLIVFAGFLLFVLPGVVFIVWFFASTYILVAENLRGTKALSRSKELVSGNWLKVFWRLFIITFLMIAINFLLNLLIEDLNLPFIGSLIMIIITPFPVIYSFLVYEDLKKLKAGPLSEPSSELLAEPSPESLSESSPEPSENI